MMFSTLLRAVSVLSYTQRRDVFRMLRELRHSRRDAFLLSVLSLGACKTYLRDSGLRLMVFRAFRDPMDVLGECYFGKNYLNDPVGHVVDVGSHTGAFSWACYKLLRPRHVHLFEPNADLMPALIALGDRMQGTSTHIHNVAAGADTALVKYHRTENPLLSSRLAFDQDGRKFLKDYNFNVIDESVAEQVTLDSVLESLDEIDLLKIDTQGYEMKVLQGATQVLRKTRVIMIETNFLSLYAEGSTFPEVHQLLTKAGFLLLQWDAPSRSRGVCVWTDAVYVARSLVFA
jgi:FkbM family methyltransferase